MEQGIGLLTSLALRLQSLIAAIMWINAPRTAFLRTNSNGQIRASSAYAQTLLGRHARHGESLESAIRAMHLDPAVLAEPDQGDRIVRIGLDPSPYLLRLLPQSRHGFGRRLLLLQPLPEEESADSADAAFLAQVAAAAAHEIRNPLAAIRAFLQETSLSRVAFSPQDVGLMTQELDRLNQLVDDLLTLLHPKHSVSALIDLRELVDGVVATHRGLLARRQQLVELRMPDALPRIRGVSQQLRQVLVNLLRNASEASDVGGEILMRAVVDGRMVRLEIQDSGPGFSDDALKHLAEPFFTTKPSGTGLGLAICQRIASAHGGSLSVRNLERGAVVLLLLQHEE